MLSEWICLTVFTCLSCLGTSLEAHLSRAKRQGLGGFSQARTTNSPFIDTDEASGVNLLLNVLGLTSAPAVDQAFGGANVNPVATQPTVTAVTGRPAAGGPATTARPPPTTTFAGYLVGSPYPFALPPPDIPYFGSKWNGPWGYPVGHYQAFRGTGQYINHYQYYPLSYFGSLMTPIRYGISGK